MEISEKEIATETRFPIRELSARTQVNTVTLRAWERRYGLLKPERTDKGHRLYCEDDVATIEKILALVARGVPLGKVKPLLQEELPADSEVTDSEDWQNLIDQMITAIDSCSASKVENLIHQVLSNYPGSISRERLMEPLFQQLAQRSDHGAALGFAESELLRYSSLRLSTKAAQKRRTTSVTLIAGNQAPLWRLALMALELNDRECSVLLLCRPFTLAAAVVMATKLKGSFTVFYQDGVWSSKEKEQVSKALLNNDRLLMFGTAPLLAEPAMPGRVFADVKECISGLLPHL